MNKSELISNLASKGIHQLNKGETAADALKSAENGTARKGYRIKFDDGRAMSENQIIAEENKQAFARSFTPAIYEEEEDAPNAEEVTEDCRLDTSKRGTIEHCFYCGDNIRVDAEYDGQRDYDNQDERNHCEGCVNDAIMRMCM